MPYIPNLGTVGRALDLVHAGLHDVFSRALEPFNAVDVSDHTLNMRDLGNYSAVNMTAIYDLQQQRTRQIVATTSSSLSLISALIAVYWFIMMRRNFRRDLVLLLILGGSFKSLWFVVFCVYTWVNGTVETEEAFCQASGYLLQAGFEQCDAAVLFMSMHMYFQIFPTTRFCLGHDGLYRVRKFVYATWMILPNLSAALAFVNPRPAFMAGGGFCSLPLRPFWYRIALFWGPRYLIWCYVVFVAVRIYRYVGSEFKVFGQERDRSSSLGVLGDSSVDRIMKIDMERNHERRQSQLLLTKAIGKHDVSDLECAPDEISQVRQQTASTADSPKINALNTVRRQSTPNWTLGNGTKLEDPTRTLPPATSYPSSRRGSQQIGNGVFAEDFAPPPRIDPNGHRGSITSLGSKRSSTAPSFTTPSFDAPSGLPSIKEGLSAPNDIEQSRPTASGAIRLRQRLIQRQLRLLFIYPCIYMLLWIIPLVVNIMNYTDYFAQNPIFALGIVNLLCVTIMTFVDVVVFCWRERPWRHIPGSDGTFTGSFMFWRYCFGTTWAQDRRVSKAPSYIPNEKELENENMQSRRGLLSPMKRWAMSRKRGSEATGAGSKRSSTTHRRTFSGGSDRKQMEGERARERLELERAEYEQNRFSFQERRLSVVSQQPTSPERKDWFDKTERDLFSDEDHDIDEKHLAT